MLSYVHVVGGTILLQHVRPHIPKHSGGAVVNFGSISAKVAQPGRCVYPVTKASMLQITRNQALELAADGIRVNSVSPAGLGVGSWTSGPTAIGPRPTGSGGAFTSWVESAIRMRLRRPHSSRSGQRRAILTSGRRHPARCCFASAEFWYTTRKELLRRGWLLISSPSTATRSATLPRFGAWCS